jgi:hypothetical protein
VTVDGKMCGGPHRHVHCSLLPAAKAEKAARTAMLNDVRPMYPGSSTAVTPTGTVTWYAVAVGRETGIFSSWAEVEPRVSGFSVVLCTRAFITVVGRRHGSPRPVVNLLMPGCPMPRSVPLPLPRLPPLAPCNGTLLRLVARPAASLRGRRSSPSSLASLVLSNHKRFRHQ